METLMLDDLTCYGLRRVHVLGDAPVRREAWLDRALEGSGVEAREYQDEIGYWHLLLIWHVRLEVVQVVFPAKVGCSVAEKKNLLGIMCYVEKGERMRDVVELAAERYLAYFDQWPELALTRQPPAGGALVKIEGYAEDVEIAVRAAEWMPYRCVYTTTTGGCDGAI